MLALLIALSYFTFGTLIANNKTTATRKRAKKKRIGSHLTTDVLPSVMADSKAWNVSFGPIDGLNCDFGCYIKVECNGRRILFTSTHPITGKDLDYAGCLEVAAMYGPNAPIR